MLFHPFDLHELTAWAEREIEADDVALLFFGESSAPRTHAVARVMAERGLGCAGAVFPQIIHGVRVLGAGCAADRVRCAFPPQLVTGLGGSGSLVMDLPSPTEVPDGTTVLVLCDGQFDHAVELANQLHARYGPSVRYLGSLAGSPDADGSSREFGVFTGEHGVRSNAAVVLFLAGKGVAFGMHGCAPVAGPFVATRSDKNVLLELNWRPAAEIFRPVAERHVGSGFVASDVPPGCAFGLANRGLIDAGQRSAERAALSWPLELLEGGGIRCSRPIPTHAVVEILRGGTDFLFDAACRVADHCAQHEDVRAGAAHKLVFESRHRVHTLGGHHLAELSRVDEVLGVLGRSPLIGGLGLAEFVADGDGALRVLDHAITLGVVPR